MIISNKKGFTLIELIVVISIITILGTVTIGNINIKNENYYINNYFNSIDFRLKEIYNKVVMSKGLSNDIKYIKISCNTNQKEMFAYNCYKNGDCNQIFFPNSYFTSKSIDTKKERAGFLNQCSYISSNGEIIDVDNFYIYIDTKFPYNIYYKIEDNNILESYIDESYDPTLGGTLNNIYIFNIEIGFNGVFERKNLLIK